MKIQTITFHSAINFGARLQCYALQKVLRRYADSVDTIDFCTDSMKYSILPRGKGIKILIRRILKLKEYNAIKRQFQKFDQFTNDHIKLTHRYSSIDELRENPPDGDLIITGSDQVFNPNRKHDERQAFYLDFPCKKRASYSASFGNSIIPEEKKEEIAGYLSKFDYLSSREKYGVDIIREYVHQKEVMHTIDPVFLLSSNEWEEVEEAYPGIPDRYILVFNLRESKTTFDVAKKLKKKTGLPVVMLSTTPYVPFRCEYKVSDCGPAEFLWLINHCTYFIEDSFHATCFSIIFHKQFMFCDDHPKSFERARTMLDDFGLNRAYSCDKIDDLINYNYSYEHVDERINLLKEKSIGYLENIVFSVQNDENRR